MTRVANEFLAMVELEVALSVAKPAKKRGRKRKHYPMLHLWRAVVRERSGGVCARCGASGVTLDAHHIIPKAERPDLAVDPANGEMLCVECHAKEHPTLLVLFRHRRVA